MLHAAVVRSPYARARIVGVSVPDGVSAFTAADLGARAACRWKRRRA